VGTNVPVYRECNHMASMEDATTRAFIIRSFQLNNG
jgi:hypothetical protein